MSSVTTSTTPRLTVTPGAYAVVSAPQAHPKALVNITHLDSVTMVIKHEEYTSEKDLDRWHVCSVTTPPAEEHHLRDLIELLKKEAIKYLIVPCQEMYYCCIHALDMPRALALATAFGWEIIE